ncbi:hypothetical protein DRN74_04175 [Candidatus Micrarchaeota archaeon]|nr:MAG: hypothetical protein DRN74_04175 [Candidatus Micrarchaeota archaeon]
MTRILIDTNIIIYREDLKEVPNDVQELLRILNETEHKVVIHPSSLEEIKKDKNADRRKIVLSKLKTYPIIDLPPCPKKDDKFISLIGQTNNAHDRVDNHLLYCVYKNAVDFLITEDEKIHRKAIKIGIADRIFHIREALEYFRKEIGRRILPLPPLKYLPAYNLNLDDPIFDSLKRDYKDFEIWWEKISREGRKARVHFVNGRIGAILILKDENEPINSIRRPLPKKKRLKICTLKVDPIDRGSKIGELFIKISIQTAIQKDIEEVYLTHFRERNDFLVSLIEEYGFKPKAQKENGEYIFIKQLVPCKSKKYTPQEVYKEFYPSFYDGDRVNKFIIPIRDKWHNRLFTEYAPRQTTLLESAGEFVVEGNTIKKAYLCHSRIRGMECGDVLLFYRSGDIRGITSLGIVEKVYDNLTNVTEIVSYVGKRSVYSLSEIKEISKKPTKIILFWWIMHFKKPIKYHFLLDNGILKGPPQTIIKIPHNKYLKIKEVAEINDRYTID